MTKITPLQNLKLFFQTEICLKFLVVSLFFSVLSLFSFFLSFFHVGTHTDFFPQFVFFSRMCGVFFYLWSLVDTRISYYFLRALHNRFFTFLFECTGRFILVLSENPKVKNIVSTVIYLHLFATLLTFSDPNAGLYFPFYAYVYTPLIPFRMLFGLCFLLNIILKHPLFPKLQNETSSFFKMAGLEFSGVLYEAVAVALKHLMSKAKIPISVVSLAGIHTGISHYHASTVESLKGHTLLYDQIINKMEVQGIHPEKIPGCSALLQQRVDLWTKIYSGPYSFASQEAHHFFDKKETLLSEYFFFSNQIITRCYEKAAQESLEIHTVLEPFGVLFF